MFQYHFFAFVIFALMGFLMVSSLSDEALTFDELAHIAAGFGYVKEQDYRLNAEHPPLIKYLAAVSADLAVHPRFPIDTVPWQQETKNQWAQWDHGTIFLYQSGNDADAVIFWSRIPMIALTLLLGILLFIWTARRFGEPVALLTAALYAFSPTILAHGRYVTTDTGAALGFFIGVISYISFLERRTRWYMFVAGVMFGIAQLLKFSLILLIPMYGIILFVWVWAHPNFSTFRERLGIFFAYAAKTVCIGIIGIGVVWIAYAHVTARYPFDRNLRDATTLLSTYRFRSHVNAVEFLIKHPITRPLGQYLTGVLLANQRAAGGNTTYFLGTVSSTGSAAYFPLLYAVKEQLMLHLLTAAALVGWLFRIGHKNVVSLWHMRIRTWAITHLDVVGCFVVVGVYWTITLISPLNIGLRHVLPTFPFLYILTAYGALQFFEIDRAGNPRVWKRQTPSSLFMFTIIIMVGVIIRAYPFYLPYYNALGGGTENGYRIAVDSNYDWGQDLLRLRA
ncbi:MAG: glycosyl transferase family protein, partial [Parcubacteria group bacterium Gr01-1014_70]